ncbi:MAG: heparinase II/III family protein [Prolixibacteraceae bacterium]|nr:heparinase II/III family protein [Prolixibacteraceae bacterium]
MKRIIPILCFACVFLVCATSLKSQTYPLTGHPRLFFLSADEATLKAKLNSTPVLKRVHDLMISESDKMLTLAVQQRVLTGKRLLSVSREAIRRISFLSYAYRMTGDARYAARAETEMLGMAAFVDWNPTHFLDVGEMTLAMAIGYDWLYSYLSVSSRTTIASAIKSKGIEKSANQSWLTSDNNWNQVCNAGISAGVAAVFDENPTYYQTLIDRAVTSIKIPMGVYKYNGAYPEGMGYWDYGTTFNVLFIDLLQRMWSTDRQLLEVEGFLSTVNFVTHMQGNATKQLSGGALKSINPLPFNFADCGNGIGVLPGMFWLAARSSDQTCIYNELQKLVFTLDNSPTGLTGNRLLPFLLIWSMNLSITDLPAPVETTYLAQGKSAVTAMRSGWGTNDIYLAMKGGTPSSNHAHMDIGSFVMEANDIRWAADLGMSDYNALETNGVDLWNMSQTSERWDVFRYNNMAHNTLTINGKKQLVTGNSLMENLVNTSALKSVELNLTSLYQNDVTNCRRTGTIVSNRYVEIKDEIKAKTNPLTVRWNLGTQAVPQKVSNKIIKLTQSTKSLYLIFEGTDQVEAKAWSTKPSTTYEEQNSDFYFTGFEFSVAAGATQTVTVKMVPAGDPILSGLDLNTAGNALNEDFESFNIGSLSSGFVSWKMNPPSNGTAKAILGEVISNPSKSGINTSNKVLRVKRQDDSEYVTPANAGLITYRGAQAYGYDLRVNTNSVIEFKYYKNAPGKIGVRIYDGNGNVLIVDFTDPYEQTANYSTAQWRTAQFAVGSLDLSKFSYTASGYLLISPERNSTETYQEKELTLYVDDVKMLPLLPTAIETMKTDQSFSAFYDRQSNRICVRNLPENTRKVRLFDIMGRLHQEVLVFGDYALIEAGNNSNSVYIIQVLSGNGTAKSIKVMR